MKKTMRKMMILVALAVLLPTVQRAQTAYHVIESHKVGALYYRILTDSTVEVLTNQDLCTQYPRNVVVPDSVTIDRARYAVVRIGDEAFSSRCGTYESVVLPETIVEIGKEAFMGFSHPIVLPESLKRIEWGAFTLCQTDTFRIPRNVEYIGEDVFCFDKIGVFVVDSGNRHYVVVDSLALCTIDTTLLLAYPGRWPDTSYTVPRTVRRIGGSAFYGNRRLRRVVLPEGLREIGACAFGSGLRSLHIPASVCRIEGSLRDTASERFTLTVAPSNRHYRFENGMLLSYAGDTLMQTVGLSGVLEVPSSVRVIGENAFIFNDALTRIVLPEGLTEIRYAAFVYVTAEIVLPSTLRTIGDYAFEYANKIRRISIPSVRTIGRYAFHDSSIETVDSALSLRTVGDYAFSATSLRSMYFGDSLQLIGESAFGGTRLGGEIVFRSHLQGIGIGALAVGGLNKVTFQQAVDTLGHHAVRCAVVQFCGSGVPVSYGQPFWMSDTVYTPCGYADAYAQAIEHEWNPVFVDWCEEGVESPEGQSVQVLYPNPCHGSVALTGIPESATMVAVRDMMGREVLRKELARGTRKCVLDVSGLPSGTYFVTLTTAKGTGTQKLVVEN